MNKIKNPWSIVSIVLAGVAAIVSVMSDKVDVATMKQEIIDELSKGNK